ncbi:SDR family NAD(P)-dependent oxidoreductase [Streptomyces anulatus]|uniref:SDR family NAD(P)-dependent oxidoreductase n=1 Tax=Streptomyces anulatus TaxID=1892 RepID=UPI0038709BC5
MSTVVPAPAADDVAIIGIALRFPGAETLEELAGHLLAGRSLISEVPPERWSRERYFGDPRRGAQKTNSVWGGFVEHADRFDADFFAISPREAESMDPQQRIALELAWRAVENAGYAAGDLAGTATGVFMGVCHADYPEMMEHEGVRTDAYFPTGTAYSIIANRISYQFDLQGPSITNDTACSSSLVAVYEAVRALGHGECGLALAGGVNLIWSPKHFVAFSQAGMLSRTGRASAFDQSADGYVRGEGGAVLLLKPLARAVADGDPVHAVIKGVATNHGGRTSSLTVTSPTAQANLIEGLYTRAGIRPETVSYIEAHGPGTPVGDPIEVMALKTAFRNLHAAQGTVARPSSCGIGSVKTNIGHLEGAAGVAGIAKVIVSLAHRALPATVNFRKQNRLINFDDSPFHVVRETRPWEAPPAGPDGGVPPRRAGVSSFGFGGTNAHIVLEEHLADGMRPTDPTGPHLVPLSARTPERLRVVARTLLTHLREQPAQALADIAHTLRIGRDPMRARVAFIVADRAELAVLLAGFADGERAEGELHLGATVRAGDADAAGLRTTGTLWAGGGTVDWAERLGDGGPTARARRVRLPGYPFARERHWFRVPPKDDGAGKAAADGTPAETTRTRTPSGRTEAVRTEPARTRAQRTERTGTAAQRMERTGTVAAQRTERTGTAAAQPGAVSLSAVPHPLLHAAVPGSDGMRFASTFTGEEPFLAAHLVRGTPVLPAAAQVEMVRAAVARAAGRDTGAPPVVRLRTMGWSRPLVVRDAAAEVRVGLTPRDGGALAFEISTGTAPGTVHSSGLAETVGAEEPGRLDLAALLAACPRERGHAEVYAEFRDRGLDYGPAMRGLRELRLGERELVARIVEPDAGGSGDTGYVLPPSVLDAAFQASVVLLADTSPTTGGGRSVPVLPFAFEQLTVHGPCAPETWAWVRRREGRGALDMFDIDLCDGKGTMSVSLRGLVQRTEPAGAAPGTGPETGGNTVTAAVSWVPAPLGAADDGTGPAPVVRGYLGGRAARHTAALAELTGFTVARLPDVEPGRVADGVGAALDLAFRDVTDVVRSKPGGPRRFVVLVDDRLPRHYHAPLTGLFRTVVLENPRVSGRVVRVADLDTAPPERIAEILRAEAADRSADCDIRHGADGTRHASRPGELHLGDGAEIPPLKEGGVYWITGGLGGLGRHVARYFGRYAGVTVVLSGRSQHGAGSEAALRELRDAGVDAHHVPVDVGSRTDVDRAVRAITEAHGAIDGIVHAAGVLRDAYVFTKDASDLRTVLAPKVDGVLHLDAASRGLTLDFFVAFSSVAGVFGGAGQSDYAAANAFLDAFAHHRQALVDIGERTGRTRAVSWPLWADGGMSVDAVTLRTMRRDRGWEPLPTEDGLRILGRVLGDAPPHVVVAHGAAATLTAAATPPEAPVTAPVDTGRADTVRADTAPAVTDEELTERATALLRRVVGEALHRDPGTLEETVDLIEYGIDSLAILDTTAALEELFGPLPKTIFFEYTDIAGVAGYFVAEHAGALRTVSGAEAPHVAVAEQAADATAPGDHADTDTDTDTDTVTAPATADLPLAEAEAEAETEVAPVSAPGGREAPGGRDDYHDIAIIGISGSYPGADTLDELWSVLEEGRHEFREVPRERWDHDAIYSRDRGVLGKSSIRTGTFLQDIDTFDPRYFRISKREAENMSPEVRLFLRAGVEALEDAGYSRETIRRKYDGDVGVLAGSMSNHYGLYGFENGLTRGSPASGSYTGTLPNMLSYFYGFTGPSLFVDTMCSGSSTCVHQAVQMLRARECSMAVAGGVNLLLHPYNLISSSQEHFTTATSDVIRSFGLGADGTILGEGVGALVLKPLVEAERDGDHVYAVIKGTALANAGVRNGFTVPSPRMQARAIEKAIDDAGVDPRTISYVEAHGSGTSLGDPIEVKALTTAYQKYTRETGFCAIGSVKSNLGHLLHAAGMIGLAKVILQFQRGQLVPSLHSSVINPDIDFSRTPFRVQQELAAWKPAVTTVDGREVTHPRRAGITSIGAGGMNSHMILEEYPRQDGDARGSAPGGREELLVLSAMNDAALLVYLARFRAFLAGAAAPDLASVAHTLRVGKNELPHRWAFLARTRDEALAAVDRRLAGDRDLAAALAGSGARTADLRDLATTWVGGKSVDWQRADAQDAPPPRRVSLPAYPFERVRCWVAREDGAPSVTAPLALREKLHPFLGRNASDVTGLRYVLDVHLDDLLDYGRTRGERQDRTRGIVPTFAVDLAIAAAKVSGFSDGSVVRGLRLLGPVDWTAAARLVTVLDASGGRTAVGAVHTEDASGRRTAVAAFDLPADGGGGTRPSGHPHAEPFVGLLPGALAPDLAEPLSPAAFLAELAGGGVGYAPELAGVEGVFRLRDGRLALRLGAPELQRDHVKPQVTLAPQVLSAVAQGLQFEAKRTGDPRWARSAPHRIDEIRLFADGAGGQVSVAYAVFDVTASGEGIAGSVGLLDRNGEVVGVLAGLWCGDDEGPREDPEVNARTAGVTTAGVGGGSGEVDDGTPGETGETERLLAFAVDELRGLASGILKFDPAELDARTGFDAFGFDSISLVALAQQAGERLGIELTPALFFDRNTFASLGEHLVAEHPATLRTAYERSTGNPDRTETPARTPEAPPRPAPDSGHRAGREKTEVPDTAPRPAAPRPAAVNSAAPIAVIGAAGRFPGAPDLDAYWANLAAGTDHVTAFPVDRYDAEYARIVEASDFPRHAGVLDEVDAFDAAFFRILPREAELMDPQHRLALQTVWNAVENSGYAPSDLPESTGLFFGVSGTDYATLLAAHGTPPDAFTSTGNAHSMLANRISYVLDIHGPSEPVDTACSSSLVAVHRAVEALRSGACDAAIAGGVNLLLSVDTFVSAARAGMLSPDGRCKTFASDANGYVRGEGVGAVVLKPLADAERDGDAILAVVVGSAENHGGRANSLTAPNGTAQADLVVRAMDGIDPRTVGYLEAHGTGTALGDPVEVQALRSAFRRLGSDGGGTCALGSVKANIGHLEAAAGIAGLLKTVLAMEHGTLPPSRNCDEINPYIQLDGSPFRIVRASEPWQRGSDRHGAPVPRRAGVSSFGFGGANCHVVMEEYPGRDQEATSARDLEDPEGRRVAVPLSARTERELRERARGLLAHLEDARHTDSLRSIAWTLQTGREAMAERVGWVVSSRGELTSRLREFISGSGDGPDPSPGQDPDGLTEVIARWCGGGEADWRQLYGPDGAGTPKRAHLPAYPFARDRYWIPRSAVASAPDRAPVPASDRAPVPASAQAPVPDSAQAPAPGRERPPVSAPAREPVLVPASGTTLLVPRWTPRPATGAPGPAAGSPFRRHAVILCGTPASLRDGVERLLPGVRCHAVTTAKQRPETRFTDLSRQVFELVRTLAGEAHDGTTLVQVVTSATEDEETGPALSALLRTTALENPRVTGQVLVLDGASDPDRIAGAVLENARHADDPLVLHRDAERHVRTWAPRTAAGAGTPWRSGGTYLITGGAGGIGAVVARRIARDTDRPGLVLVGRSAPGPRTDRLLAELRAAGAEARYAVADVSRWEEVRRLVAEVRERSGAIHGVIHAAGVIHDAYVKDKTPEEWELVLAPKVDGAVHLDRATADLPLESFLLFSSGAAVTGNPGQCDYATANAHLGTFAARRNARVAAGGRSGRTVSIAWPLWKDGGMTVDDATRAYLRRHRGLVPMESDAGLDALLNAWRLGEAGEDQIWVHHGEPEKAAPASASVPEPVDGAAPDRETLRSVLGIFAQVTKLPPHAIDPDRPLDELALDSVMVIQLNRELHTVFGETSTTLFYEAPTLRAVAEHLTGPRIRTGQETSAAPGVPEAPRAAAEPSGAPAQDDAIAIIGMSGRYPGARNTDEFWQNLTAGRDRITEVPRDRWPLDGFYEPDRATAVATGLSYSKWGGFLEDFDAFDPHFFRIAPRDAYAMDPQERLFLQASWEVIEDAGYTREELARRHRRRVGVFAGVTKSGHARHGEARLPSGERIAPALSFASLSARTSYVLDFRGPSLTIDTMCSSSLTAIHEACEHLRQGSCELAVAGGVNLYLHPSDYVELCRSGMLSAQSRVRSFGSGADGFVPGEGVGAVLLKPLARALADGDRVLAVIRGTSINHGGRSVGYTVPSPAAQAELIGDALTRAGISAREVGYVEAHGTGTELGDPIEVKGLSLAYEKFTGDRQFCAIGSVKSVIGHLEAAAGIAGVTKAVLQLRHRTLVPSLHAEEPNPGIRFEETPFRLQRTLAPWESARPRVTAVSSFGAGGSNAHVIIEEYVADAAPAERADGDGEQLVVLSARTPERLRHSAARLVAFLEQEEAHGRTVRPADLAFTLRSGREAMKERLAVTVLSLPELRRVLRAFAESGDGTAIPGLHRGGAGQDRGAAAEIWADDDLRELVAERWGREGKHDKLAALWAGGMDLDWRALPGAVPPPRRISLPTYPFARDRFWIGDLEPAGEAIHTGVRTGASTGAPTDAPAAVAPRTAPEDSPGDPAAVAPRTAPGTSPGDPAGTAPGDRIARLVRAKIADVLVMSPDEIEGGLAFADYGLDSILAVRLVHVLNEELGGDLATDVVFDHSSADRLAAHLLAEYGPVAAPTPVPPAPAASAPVPARTRSGVTSARPATGGRSVPVGPPAGPEPIAVVGMSGRFAGSDTLDELWTHLANGDDLITEATRWDLPATGPDGSARCTQGGFLDGIDRFDPLFFGISGVEAAVMDPQQRLLLEEAWKALEDAGHAGRQLSGSRCGVYVGCWNGDYHELLGENGPAQAFWGNMASLIPARVSYVLNLKGPALAVDTACSSSLIAIDLACRGLRSGETDMALAGGVFVQSTPRLYELAGRAGMLSPTGRCHTFDHRADGFVPGEGVGVLVLKRLGDAIADGDHIHGVIRATGSNHDGATNGITAPSSVSQEALLRDVHASCGIDAGSIQLLEAHGTGTPLGDPIEFSALSRVFRSGTERTGFCALGSVKSNLGHTQFAAGVAGVFKILLAMRHRQIPASLHFEKPVGAIDLDTSPFYLSTRAHAWEPPSDGGPRRGGVSSFGASGTNAHLVIEEAPDTARTRARTPGPMRLVVLSAHSREQLAQQVARLAERIRHEDAPDLGDLAYTLAVGRDRFPHRFACVAEDRADLLRILDEGLDGTEAFTGRAAPEGKGRPYADTSRGEACLERCARFTATETDAAKYGAEAGNVRAGADTYRAEAENRRAEAENRRTDAENRRADAETYRADLTVLAGCFVRGAALDYGALFPAGAHRRVPLPTYPFARESHWAGPPPAAPRPVPATPGERPAGGHPLIHRTSEVPGSPGALRASTMFTGAEPVLRDHTVRGQRVLPGVVHLELARETAVRLWGADAAAPLLMRDITWVRPATADGGGPLGVDVLVKPGDDDQLTFEITARADRGAGPVVLSTGRLSRTGTSRPESVDLTSLRAACTTTVSAERVREALASMGIVHGPSLRAIREAYVDTGTGTVLAELELPAGTDPADGGPVLPPAMLDSAIQASIALHLTDGPADPETAVPFALDRFELLAPCPSSARAVVRVADGAGPATALSRLDVDITDVHGRVCVRMTGYTSRRLKEPVPSLFAPVWEPVATYTPGEHAPDPTDHVLVVGGTAQQRAALVGRYPGATPWDLAPGASADEIADRLRATAPVGHLVWIASGPGPDDGPALLPTDTAGFAAAQEDGVVAAFRTAKALVRTGHDARPLRITLVTRRALATYDDEPTAPAHAGLHGFFGSLAQEYANWSVRRADLDTAELPDDLLAPPGRTGDDPLAHRAGQWLARRWAPNEPGDTQPVPYRQGGVYVVIGGAGGLGTQWTRHVVRNHDAHVIWIGRRPRDASIDARLAEAGGRVSYLSADAADPASLRLAHKEVKRRHPRIHGVVQAALDLRDQSLARMDEATLRASLAAKVDVGVAMAEVFADEALDFALFFSSVQSFTTAAGQSNYAAGCTFGDAYAHFLDRHWPCPVKVMNWGWWGSVGSASTERHKEHMARWGLLSIEAPEAMDALDTLLGGPQRQLSFVKVKGLDAIEALDPTTRITVHPRARTRVAPARVASAAALPAEWEAMRAIAAWRSDERDPLLARMVRGHLQTLGGLRGPGTPTSPGDIDRLRRRAGILDRYATWLDHALRFVPDTAPSLDALVREWDECRARWSTDPDKAAELALLDATLRALPGILTGATRPTDILFPRGSVELVEGTYRDNRVADLYNRAMADAAVSVVAERLRLDPSARIRILEIGAGTGGTSVGMFAALRPFQEHIETYTYTDLSKAFLNHARAAYGPDVPYLSYARFDAEQPLAGQQGVESGSYDLVVAANVLHATRDTRNTIRNAKAALRDGGWLLLNELAAFDVSSHLTFGLLEGWWLFEDDALRVPGSPALSPENWRKVLESEGFAAVVPVLPEARELGQQIIAAESDGLARQSVARRTDRKPAARKPGRRQPADRQPMDRDLADRQPTDRDPADRQPADRNPAAPVAVDSPPRPVAVAVPRHPDPVPAFVQVPAQPLDAGGAVAPSAAEPGNRAEALAGYLRDRAAETLGIPADRIALSTPLSDYGMDSILVLQLTNALREDLGEVSSTLLFDAESVEELADHFATSGGPHVDTLVARLNPAAGDRPVPGPALRPSADSPRSVATLFRTVLETGTPQQAGDLLSMAARLRPVFAAGAGDEPELLRLSDGRREPDLVCLPSLIAPTGAHQYVNFAGALRGRRQVWAVSVPGYRPGEPLPVDLEAAAERLAATLLRRFGGGEFALAGYSSGGWLAHEVVRRLEAAGAPPAGLVLLDTPRTTGAAMVRGMTVITRRLLDRFPRLPLADEQVTAMAWYGGLLDGWRPLPVTTPTLLAGAAQAGPLLELLGEDARSGWPLEHRRTEVAGDHFSLLEEHAGATALTVDRWLDTSWDRAGGER